jgi:hypothetical protein
MPGDVARGPDAWVAGAHVGVDQDLLAEADLDSRLPQPEAGGSRASTGGNQQLLGPKLAAVSSDHDLIAVPAHFGRDGVLDHGDAVSRERVAECRGDLGLLPPGEL